jgi:cytochrome c peroxidase
MSSGKNRIVVIILAVTGLLIVLAMPISNYFLVRKPIQIVGGGPQFEPVSKIMQASCADCHSPGLVGNPIYAQFPLAKDLIQKDIREAQSAFALTEDELSGVEKIPAADMARIATVVTEGTMPPFKYTAMHWDARLTHKQRDAIFAYVQARQDDDGAALAVIPQHNPFKLDHKKVALGEKLFFDKRLSRAESVSCASCHALDKGGADAHSNAPTVFNSAFNFRQFADGHSSNLIEQAKEHIADAAVMNADITTMAAKLGRDPTYGAMARAAYGSELTASDLVESLVCYEKTLITPDCAFDRYLRGDKEALNEREKLGYQLFMEKNCAGCHNGVGVGGMSMAKGLSGKKIKVPLLRNIALTGPYFSNGSAKTLNQAVDVMAQKMAGSKLSPSENQALVAFLRTLTGKYRGQKLQ